LLTVIVGTSSAAIIAPVVRQKKEMSAAQLEIGNWKLEMCPLIGG
jgi:hypothetical protein